MSLEKITPYNVAYNKGYFKALLDFKQYLEINGVVGGSSSFCSTKKQTQLLISKSLQTLLEDDMQREHFKKFGGNIYAKLKDVTENYHIKEETTVILK